MAFRRRILRYGPSPDQLVHALEDRVVAGCQFELHCLGGCGRGELKLHDGFDARTELPVGQWIACEYDDGERWYLGRVEERRATHPGGVTLRLEGMSIQLNEVFPGGFGLAADGQRPHRYGVTDRFVHDPDRAGETADWVERAEDVVRLLISQYVVPATDIKAEAGLIENSPHLNEFVSLKFHGEETVRSILKDLALRVQNASWGVDEWGRFYFLQRRTTVLATYQLGVNLVELTETSSRESLYNRVLLTGGYVYPGDLSGLTTAGALRWRGNYRQPDSITQFGERRIRLWVPWIRSPEDSRQFVREFFRIHAQPRPGYALQAVEQTMCPQPWWGQVAVLDRDGATLIVGRPETIRVRFDNTPRLLMEIGPDNPRTHWPEPPHDERFPVAGIADDELSGPGGNLSLTEGVGIGTSGGGGGPSEGTSGSTGFVTSSDLFSSEHSGDDSSLFSSLDSTAWASSELVSSELSGTMSLVDSNAVTSLASSEPSGWDSTASSEESDDASSKTSADGSSSGMSSEMSSESWSSTDSSAADSSSEPGSSGPSSWETLDSSQSSPSSSSDDASSTGAESSSDDLPPTDGGGGPGGSGWPPPGTTSDESDAFSSDDVWSFELS